jgi:hypothetical protein
MARRACHRHGLVVTAAAGERFLQVEVGHEADLDRDVIEGGLTCATMAAGTLGTIPSSSRARCSAQNPRSFRSAAMRGPAS